MDSKDCIDLLSAVGKLKDTTRHSWTPQGRHESVAEHSWRVAVMAYLLQDEFKDFDIDFNKLTSMCLFHDLGEAVTGDIPAWKKTDADRHHEEEELHKLIDSFPDSVKERLRVLFVEMEEQKTNESKLYKALDKFETIISHNEADLSTWNEQECMNHTTNFIYLNKHILNQFLAELKEELHEQMIAKVENNRK